ncbi:MAG: hypothetical protein WC551_08205 [Patescibacteria group bacterium]
MRKTMRTKRTKRTTKPRREGLLPNQYHQGPVTVVAPFRIEEGGILRGVRKYIVETWRTEGEWSMEIQWIETRGEQLSPTSERRAPRSPKRMNWPRNAPATSPVPA